MTEQRRGLSTGLVALFALLFVFLCAGTSVGGFLIGRQTASDTETERIVEVTVPVEITREVIVEVEVDRQADAPTETPSPTEPAGENGDGTDDESDDPDAEPIDGEEIVPLPTPTFEPGARGAFTEEDLEILHEAWEIIEEDFDGQLPNDEDLRYAIVEFAISTLGDDFTRFVRPEIAERSREMLGGSFEGIGALVRENDEGRFEIVRPFDDQPADLAGLKEGDVIIGVDGESIVGLSLEESVQLVRGPEGTPVTLAVVREGVADPFEITIVRARIVIPVVEAELLPEGIAYVRLTQFNRNAEAQLVESLTPILAENPQGIILDLRDNPGGFLDQAIAVTDLFLPEGVAMRERNASGLDEVFETDDGDLGEELPLVVLVNAGSASASEIVAGAVQDRDRGVIIGGVTFGKGSVQSVRELSDGSEIRVTIARWYTPDDHSIDGEGITPDIEVETPEDLGGDTDTQLQRAIEYLLNES